MTTTVMTVVGIGIIAFLASAFVIWRVSSYRRWLKYDPALDYATPAFNGDVETIAVRCSAEGFSLPSLSVGAVSGFLELTVKSTVLGWLDDPRVELEADHVKDAQYFERGARGRRFLNVSRLLTSGIKPKQRVALRGRGVKWWDGWVRLHLCRDRLEARDRLVVVAPHPDDAEIAAFGLYSGANATVVTVTAGDDTGRFDVQPGGAVGLPRHGVARLRVWDSLSVPALGGIPAERVVNLCYADGRLVEMNADPAREFASRSGAVVDYAALRRLNSSRLVENSAFCCSWDSLVHDLAAVFRRCMPTVVVTPLPLVDSHPDHGLTTLAVCEALRRCDMGGVRLFLYVVHNRWTELYPFGPAGSGVSLPPHLDGGMEFAAFYSHSLSPEQQNWKQLALEAMHDVRELTPAVSLTLELRRLKSAAGAWLRGWSNPPTCLLRRSVRPDEVFFVMNVKQAEFAARAHAEQVRKHCQ